MSAIEKISDGKKDVDCSYYLRSGIYVTCAFPYRNVSIRLWKMANGRKYATAQGISLRFNEWNEFIKVAQKCIQNIQKYIPVNPAFWIKIDQGMMSIHVKSARLIQKPPAGVRFQRIFHYN